ENRERNGPGVCKELVEGERWVQTGSYDHIRRVSHHRRDSSHVRGQDLCDYERDRIDPETVKDLNSQWDDEQGYRDDVEERSHTSSQQGQQNVHPDRVGVDGARQMKTHPLEEAGLAERRRDYE